MMCLTCIDNPTPTPVRSPTMDVTIGTCSLCGGPVTVPELWAGVVPPVPKCRGCGATKKSPHGPVIEMVPGPGPVPNPRTQTKPSPAQRVLGKHSDVN